jgi:hypothetical protein
MVIVKVQVEIVKELLNYLVIYQDVRMAIIEVLMAIVKELQDRRRHHQQQIVQHQYYHYHHRHIYRNVKYSHLQ